MIDINLRPQAEMTPIDWLECDGSEFDPAKYPELVHALRDAYGKNRLPDLRSAL
jgi:hypothetical protein